MELDSGISYEGLLLLVLLADKIFVNVQPSTDEGRQERLWNRAVWLVLAVGVLLRLVLFAQNRNLIIDEANIVRNLYERNFMQLLRPLDYEQYAPPVFLWVEEMFSRMLGFSEQAMRLFPLLTSIASLFVFRSLLKPYITARALWLPMAMAGWTYLLIRYSVEVKQYMPDAFVALALVWLAQRWHLLNRRPAGIAFFWTTTGALAILSSMPSVFILAAIGTLLLAQCVRYRKWNYLPAIVLTGLSWLMVFGIYYKTVLESQIHSSYLQQYHDQYFLHLVPRTADQWLHNWNRLAEIIGNMGGPTAFNLVFSLVLLAAGVYRMMQVERRLLLLTVLPILLTIMAAALRQFSLIDRVVLFLLPLLLVAYAFGFQWLITTQKKPLRIFWMIAGIVAIATFNRTSLLWKRLGDYELTAGLDYMLQKQVPGRQVYVHHASVPPMIYYTRIHPGKQYQPYDDAHLLTWDMNYATIGADIKDTAYFVCTGGWPEEERKKRTGEWEVHLRQFDFFEKYICQVYGYVPK